MSHEELKRSDQIRLLEKSAKFTDTGEWEGTFTYPNCGYDLVKMRLATKDKKITEAGRVALWLLGKGPDQTESKAVESFKFGIANQSLEWTLKAAPLSLIVIFVRKA